MDINENNSKIQTSDDSEKVAALEKQAQEYLAGWKRANADFINYKQDEGKRALQMQQLARASILKRMLPLLDSLEEAQKHGDKNLKAITQQLKQVMREEGLKEIEALGEEFNPQFHESVGMVESDKPEHTIIEELRKGYVVDGITLRPSMVKISTPPNKIK